MSKCGLRLSYLIILVFCGTAVRAQSSTGDQGPAGVSQSGQAQPSHQMEEIVVTARKRTESLQNVPVAVAPITKAELENNDATDLSKLAELAPQVIIGSAATGTGGILTIRGISSSAFDSGFDQSVTVDIDGIPLSRGRIIVATLYDMQQVEVLEGPQALFFGKNSPAGVISLHTADPTNEFEGYAKAGYEFIASERYGEAVVSGPLSDTLKARLAVRGDYMDGWIKNVAQPVTDPLDPAVTEPGADYGATQPKGYDVSTRLTLLWAPTDNFDAKFKADLDRRDLNGETAFSQEYCVGNTTVPVLLGTIPVPGGNCNRNIRTVSTSGLPAVFAVNYPYGNDGRPYQNSEFGLGSLTLTERINAVTLTSTTGYYNQSHSDASTDDDSPFATIYEAEHEAYQLWTQELRANTELSIPINFMGGVYYEHSRRTEFSAPDIFNVGVNPVDGSYTDNELSELATAESYSAFAQARWNIIPTVELAAGARYTDDEKNLRAVQLADNPVAPFIGLPVRAQGDPLIIHYSGNNVSPEATLSWHPETDQTLYAAYKTGYKSGGIAGSIILVSSNAQNLTVGPEHSHGFEFGYKADLFDRRVRLDLTAYRYNYDGLQIAVYNAATLNFSVNNAAAALTQGIEGGLKWLATDSLSFSGNVGFNHARFLSYQNALCYGGQTVAEGCINGVQNRGGQPLVRAPNVTFDIGGEYKTKLWSGWTGDLTADAAYTSKYQSADDNDPGGMQGAFWRINAALHVLSDDGHYDLAVIGRDLTDSYYLITSNGWSASDNNNERVGFFNRPREVVLEAQYRF